IAFVDTPGIHRPRNELGKRMNAATADALQSADVFVMMTDVWQRPPKTPNVSAWAGEQDPLNSPWLRPGDKDILVALKKRNAPTILAVNKVDLAKDKTRVLPMLEAYSMAYEFATLIPMSVRRNQGVAELL